MNWSNVNLILQREIRDQLRDRRTLFMIAILPLLLYPLLGMSFFQITQFMQEHSTRVVVVGAGALEKMEGLPRLIENDRFSKKLFSNQDRVDLLELEVVPDGEAQEARLDEAMLRLQQGEVENVVYFPSDFASQLDRFRKQLFSSESETAPKEQDPVIPSPVVYHNSASEKSRIAFMRVTAILDRWTSAIGTQNLLASRVPVLAAHPFQLEPTDVADKRHRDMVMWSKVLPFVLLIWALTGAFYPAIDLCAGEKERGTLETLLSSPAERTEIVWGKLLTIILFSIATATLNLAGMAATGTFVVGQLNALGALPPGSEIGVPPLASLGWLLVALLPVSALFSALCLALAAFARSTKEGQYYLMPLVLIIMPLMILPMAPGVELTLGNSLIPVTGVVLLLRNMLEGNYLVGARYCLPVIAVTLGCCLLAIRWAVDQFNRESVLFRESERLDLGLWVRHLVRDRGPTPSVAGAISCFVLILMIKFFMGLAMRSPVTLAALGQQIFISQVVVIALPALLMTIMLTRLPARTLLLTRWPGLAAIGIAGLLAVVLHPLGITVSVWIQQLYPVSSDLTSELTRIGSLLETTNSVWVPLLLIAILPAICEEIAFRGFILSGLRHFGNKWRAITLSALFFGIAHGVLQQSISAALLGVIIGYIAVQTGSLLPCILFHATYNAMSLFCAKIEIAEETFARWSQLNWVFDREILNGQVHFSYAVPLLVVCLALSACLLLWLRRLPYQKTEEEALQEAIERQAWVLRNEEHVATQE